MYEPSPCLVEGFVGPVSSHPTPSPSEADLKFHISTENYSNFRGEWFKALLIIAPDGRLY